jgi:fibro-slime domain-containing protein
MRPGMVANTLDAEHKPVLGTIHPSSRNVMVGKWFRPWVADDQIPNYTWTAPSFGDAGWWGGCDCGSGQTLWATACLQYWNATVTYNGLVTGPDTAFRNVVIQSSLTFQLSDPATGTYVFEDSTFFPLDGQGFGFDNPYSLFNNYADPNGMQYENNWLLTCNQHNYSYTMELQMMFTLKAAQQNFSFIGDDDLWVFIDDKLALDIGGVHTWHEGTIDIAQFATANGLNDGQNYRFSLFYAERQSEGSHIRITTNLIAPATVLLRTIADSLTAGTAQEVVEATVLDEQGNEIPVDPSQITWELVQSSVQPGDQLQTATGLTATLYAETAWRSVEVRASYTDPETGITVSSTIAIPVRPGPADHVSIEPLTQDSIVADLNADNPQGSIHLPLSQDTGKAYAVLRDRFGNYVDLARNALWGSLAPATAAVAPDPLHPWIGLITRGASAATTDSTYLTASYGTLTPDTVKVVVDFTLRCAQPEANPPGGDYFQSVSVTLTTSTAGAQIYYCIDCAGDPTVGDPNTFAYTGPITISAAQSMQ